MKILIINIHLTYLGWSEGELNLAFMQLAKAFFVERGHQVAETSVERGYNPEEEVEKHVAADLVILQTPVNWFSAPWIYRNTWARSSMSAWPKKSCSRAMTAREKTPAGSMAWAAKCRERSSWSPRPGMLREKPSITPTGYCSAARERPTCSSTSLPTTNSQVRHSPGFWGVRYLQEPRHPARA